VPPNAEKFRAYFSKSGKEEAKYCKKVPHEKSWLNYMLHN
jgi:hypothetical protein